MKDGFREDRREFLKDIARKLALGTLVLGTGILVRRPLKRGETCTSDGICTKCSALRGCGLPQALSARRASGDG